MSYHIQKIWHQKHKQWSKKLNGLDLNENEAWVSSSRGAATTTYWWLKQESKGLGIPLGGYSGVKGPSHPSCFCYRVRLGFPDLLCPGWLGPQLSERRYPPVGGRGRCHTYTKSPASSRTLRSLGLPGSCRFVTEELTLNSEFWGAGAAGRPDQRRHLQPWLPGPEHRRTGLERLTWRPLAWRQGWEFFPHLGAPELSFRSWTTLERGIQLVREPSVLTWTYGQPPSASSPSSGCTNGARDLRGTPAAPADSHAP